MWSMPLAIARQRLARCSSRDVLYFKLSHQYLVTQGVKLSWPHTGKKLPLLRDPDSSYYLRQEKDGLLLGPYGLAIMMRGWTRTTRCRMIFPFSFTLTSWNAWNNIFDAIARVPILRKWRYCGW